ncbi:hypothetical protein JXB01_02565 [Candidatus Micrarchaeota archaeon]|nr:hypothetical protein [Candidatus Micrarchaeota archaeon]
MQFETGNGNSDRILNILKKETNKVIRSSLNKSSEGELETLKELLLNSGEDPASKESVKNYYSQFVEQAQNELSKSYSHDELKKAGDTLKEENIEFLIKTELVVYEITKNIETVQETTDGYAGNPLSLMESVVLKKMDDKRDELEIRAFPEEKKRAIKQNGIAEYLNGKLYGSDISWALNSTIYNEILDSIKSPENSELRYCYMEVMARDMGREKGYKLFSELVMRSVDKLIRERRDSVSEEKIRNTADRFIKNFSKSEYLAFISDIKAAYLYYRTLNILEKGIKLVEPDSVSIEDTELKRYLGVDLTDSQIKELSEILLKLKSGDSAETRKQVVEEILINVSGKLKIEGVSFEGDILFEMEKRGLFEKLVDSAKVERLSTSENLKIEKVEDMNDLAENFAFYNIGPSDNRYVQLKALAGHLMRFHPHDPNILAIAEKIKENEKVFSELKEKQSQHLKEMEEGKASSSAKEVSLKMQAMERSNFWNKKEEELEYLFNQKLPEVKKRFDRALETRKKTNEIEIAEKVFFNEFNNYKKGKIESALYENLYSREGRAVIIKIVKAAVLREQKIEIPDEFNSYLENKLCAYALLNPPQLSLESILSKNDFDLVQPQKDTIDARKTGIINRIKNQGRNTSGKTVDPLAKTAVIEDIGDELESTLEISMDKYFDELQSEMGDKKKQVHEMGDIKREFAPTVQVDAIPCPETDENSKAETDGPPKRPTLKERINFPEEMVNLLISGETDKILKMSFGESVPKIEVCVLHPEAGKAASDLLKKIESSPEYIKYLLKNEKTDEIILIGSPAVKPLAEISASDNELGKKAVETLEKYSSQNPSEAQRISEMLKGKTFGGGKQKTRYRAKTYSAAELAFSEDESGNTIITDPRTPIRGIRPVIIPQINKNKDGIPIISLKYYCHVPECMQKNDGDGTYHFAGSKIGKRHLKHPRNVEVGMTSLVDAAITYLKEEQDERTLTEINIGDTLKEEELPFMDDEPPTHEESVKKPESIAEKDRRKETLDMIPFEKIQKEMDKMFEGRKKKPTGETPLPYTSEQLQNLDDLQPTREDMTVDEQFKEEFKDADEDDKKTGEKPLIEVKKRDTNKIFLDEIKVNPMVVQEQIKNPDNSKKPKRTTTQPMITPVEAPKTKREISQEIARNADEEEDTKEEPADWGTEEEPPKKKTGYLKYILSAAAVVFVTLCISFAALFSSNNKDSDAPVKETKNIVLSVATEKEKPNKKTAVFSVAADKNKETKKEAKKAEKTANKDQHKPKKAEHTENKKEKKTAEESKKEVKFVKKTEDKKQTEKINKDEKTQTEAKKETNEKTSGKEEKTEEKQEKKVKKSSCGIPEKYASKVENDFEEVKNLLKKFGYDVGGIECYNWNMRMAALKFQRMLAKAGYNIQKDGIIFVDTYGPGSTSIDGESWRAAQDLISNIMSKSTDELYSMIDHSNIKHGARGLDVVLAQIWLNKMGQNIQIDGIAKDETMGAYTKITGQINAQQTGNPFKKPATKKDTKPKTKRCV